MSAGRFGTFLLLAASTLVAALAAEAALRASGRPPADFRTNPSFEQTGWSAPDAELGWINKAGEARSTEHGRKRMNFWEDGQRASDPAPDPHAERSIWVVGDSLAQAYGVEDRDSFTARLNQRHPDVAFLNFGTGGYSSHQSLLRLQREFARGTAPPELVIYGFWEHHALRNVATYDWVSALTASHGSYVVPPHVTLQDGALAFHGGREIAGWPWESHSSLVTAAHRLLLWREFGEREEQALEATRLVLSQMHALAQAHGSRLLVAFLLQTPQDIFQFVREERIDFAGCANPDFLGDPRFQLGGNGHPTPLQHRLWAVCLSQWLDRNGIASPRTR